ncbi:armadillo repeat-containing protein 1-like [Denticeps clupeoides]|nr:armadillo repeat-containing protein 1-like [Denticeps clupeoides]XP_028857901.1 armadillo repeat-containing protein 1-like [Denticeps clupeoides]XP_028857902.1 armadillo repeat-containing protein 1-like [Denticeps clupeoides]XP_028858235.1 armadillo repeat-containing protein 1-like [Denticeps clupeoides]XP_028858236.1 armadillo repeat-containing protein 1-like [Denticeps clupeoides]XP_028858237.1 armadillo repeat-containing protein 1-like [Denticeps clupeoides]
MMDALSVVTQLRDLASEPQNREAIVQDQGCLPGLVLFLDHKDPQVQFATLQTLRYLAESATNVDRMKGELGMMVSLENLMEKGSESDDVRMLADEVYGVLSGPGNRGGCRTPAQQPRRNKTQFFINSSNKKAKSVTLYIQGLDGLDQRCMCEEALLKVRGVISFTFQMALKRCTVRVRSDLPTENLATAIAATKILTAQQVVKNDTGDEVLIPLSSSETAIQENSHVPDYLPEDESPQSDLDRAVSRTAAKDSASGSWLNAAAGFLTKTFYW